MKRIRLIIISVLLFLTAFPNNYVLAEETCVKNDEIKSLSYKIAENYLLANNIKMTIDDCVPLYDGSDMVKGYLLIVKDGKKEGYVTVFAYNGTLVPTESSFEYVLNTDGYDKIYYNGPFEYYGLNEHSDDIVNLERGYSKNRSILKTFEPVSIESSNQKLNAQMNAQSSSSTHSLSHPVTAIRQDDASTDGEKKCMQTSAAMLILYYKQNYYSTISSTTNGVTLLNTLSNYIPLTNNSYTTLSSLKSGLASYISSRGFSSTITSNSCDLGNDTLPMNFTNTMANELDNDKPMIIIVGSEANFTSGDNPISNGSSALHAMLVRSVFFYGNNTNNVYIGVVDPWNASSKQILWDPVNTASRAFFAVYSVVRVTIY